MIETFTALAEPNRLRIVELLRAGPRPVGDIGERLRLRQPQVSKHLRVLKEAGLVEVEPRAQERHYALRGAALRDVHVWIERYRGLWDERFEQIDSLLEALQSKDKEQQKKKPKGRPGPKRR